MKAVQLHYHFPFDALTSKNEVKHLVICLYCIVPNYALPVYSAINLSIYLKKQYNAKLSTNGCTGFAGLNMFTSCVLSTSAKDIFGVDQSSRQSLFVLHTFK